MKRLLPLLLLAACAVTPEGDNAKISTLRLSNRTHAMPRHAAAPSAGPSGAHLNDYGGKVIGNVKVVQVLYGQGTYAPEISGEGMASFYTQLVQSPYLDWLSEYDTPTQQIRRGSFAGKFTIAPAAAGSTLTNDAVQTELSAQIDSGALPAPDADTLYMINFPHGKVITNGSEASCQQFCAYHGTFQRNGQEIFYGVLPDMSAGSGCENGCGGNPTPFNNQSSVASHELIEAVTDAEVGIATVIGPPLAWYDAHNGEIGDICNAQQGDFTGQDGVTYTVQQEWSNRQGACVDHAAAAPQSCTVDADCPSGDLCQNGACVPAPPAAGPFANGDFESGLDGWTASGAVSLSASAHGGASAAMVGSASPGSDSSLTQTFTVPDAGGVLGFWYQVVCNDSVRYDWASATLADLTAGTTQTLLANTCSRDGVWRYAASSALAPGHVVKLTLANHDDGYAGDPTYTLYDDVTVAAPGPAACALTANPAQLSFAVPQGDSGQGVITLTSAGTGPCQITQIGLSDSSDPAFSASGSPATLAPGATLQVKVSFVPTAATGLAVAGTLVIASDDAAGPLQIALSAQQLHGISLFVSPAQLTFDTAVGTAPAAQAFLLYNYDIQGQTVRWSGSADDDALSLSPPAGVLPPLQSMSIAVSVAAPTEAGTRTQTVTLDAGAFGKLTVPVTITARQE